MEPGGGGIQTYDGNQQVSSRLHRLGDESVTGLKKCIITVAGLSADYEMECRMLERKS